MLNALHLRLLIKLSSEVKLNRKTIKIYFKGIIISVYDIWQKNVFKHVFVDLNNRISEYDYFYTYVHVI